jgi:hypothetical protein
MEAISYQTRGLANPDYKEKPSGRIRWTSQQIDQLISQAADKAIGAYPTYICNRSYRKLFKHLPLTDRFSCKQLVDKYYEFASPKADRAPLTEDEINKGRIFRSVNPKSEWADLAKYLFDLMSTPDGFYRPAGFLKNNVRTFTMPEDTPPSYPSETRSAPTYFTKTDTNRISSRAKSLQINPYPAYIHQCSIIPPFGEIKLGPQFTTKQIKDKFYEVLSPKANTEPLTSDEKKAIREYKILYPSANWIDFSKHLFELENKPDGSYRPAGFLKNNTRTIFKEESEPPLSAPSPKVAAKLSRKRDLDPSYPQGAFAKKLCTEGDADLEAPDCPPPEEPTETEIEKILKDFGCSDEQLRDMVSLLPDIKATD